jgi:hypothetical protein
MFADSGDCILIRRTYRRMATAILSGAILYAGTGCLPEGTLSRIAGSSASSVASTLLDLIVIDTLESALERDDAA